MPAVRAAMLLAQSSEGWPPFPRTYFRKVLVPILTAANLAGGALDHPSRLDYADIAWRNIEGAKQLALDVLAHACPAGLVRDIGFRHDDHFFAAHIGVEQAKSNAAALLHAIGLATDFLQVVRIQILPVNDDHFFHAP